MPKVLTISGMVVAGILLLLFIIDIAAGWPFKKASMMMDIGFILCAWPWAT